MSAQEIEVKVPAIIDVRNDKPNFIDVAGKENGGATFASSFGNTVTNGVFAIS